MGYCRPHTGQHVFAAANAPEFHLHHANVDRLWNVWQQRSANHAMAFDMAQVDTPFIVYGTKTTYLPVKNTQYGW